MNYFVSQKIIVYANNLFNKETRMDITMQTISRLKLLGTIKKGEKINTKSIAIQPDSFITSFSRTFIKQDNRNNTIAFIQETIQRSFDLITKYDKSDDETEQILKQKILEDIGNAIHGLDRLKETYSEDNRIVCELETLLTLIKAKLVTFVNHSASV